MDYILDSIISILRLPRWHLVVKNPPANAEDIRHAGLISGFERSPREGNGNPFQDSYPENPVDGGARLAAVHGVTKIQAMSEAT